MEAQVNNPADVVGTRIDVPSAETPKVETSPNPTAGVENDKVTTESEEPAPYTPDLKYRVNDQDVEFDPVFKSLIKDIETEKKVRQLYADGHGLPVIKKNYEELGKKYANTNERLGAYETGVKELGEFVQRGDFDSFLAYMKIPQEKVLQWVLDKAQYNELPVEQRQVLDAKNAAEKRAYSLEKENASSQQQYQQEAVQARQYALQLELGQPDISQFAQSFDTKLGKAGAFKDAVIKNAHMKWVSEKVDLTPKQAIEETMRVYKAFLTPSPEPMQTDRVQPTQTVETEKRKPTIPSVTGKTTSPMKSKVRSLDDLKTLHKQMSGQT